MNADQGSETESTGESARCAVLAGPFIAVAVGSVIRITTVPRSSHVSTSEGDSKGKARSERLPPRHRPAVEIPSIDMSDITVLIMDQSPVTMNTTPAEGASRGFPIRLAAFHRSGHFDVFSFMLRDPYSNSEDDDDDDEPLLDTPILPMYAHLAPPTPTPFPIPVPFPTFPLTAGTPAPPSDPSAETRLARVQNIVSAAYHHQDVSFSLGAHLARYLLTNPTQPPASSLSSSARCLR